MFTPRVSIPSAEGTFTKTFGKGLFSNHRLRKAVGPKNTRTFQLLAIAWTSLLGDSPHDIKPNSVISRFIKSFYNDPIKVIDSYSNLAHTLRTSVHMGQEGIFIDAFCKDFKSTPVFREYLAFYRTKDPSLFSYLLTFLSFGKKIAYEDEQLDDTALRGWHEVEERLREVKLPKWARNLRPFWELIFENWSEPTFLPKHGNGSVANRDVRGVNRKNEEFYLPRTLKYMYYRKENIFQNVDVIDVTPGGNLATVSDVGLTDSRLMFVPKTYKTSRSICMEPIPYMHAQQGVRVSVERTIADGILKHFVQLRDQGTNQRFAQFGSLTQLCDTLDLSSASDSVLWRLIKIAAPARVLKHLAATRTSVVQLPDGSRIKVQKFAPMGSALCFPIQSILYSSVILMISVAQTYGIDWRKENAFAGKDVKGMVKETYPKPAHPRQTRGNYVPFRCYGDDLIVDSRLSNPVVEALNTLGFEVNTGKSFFGSSAFRESCGKEYLYGVDVSPYIFKVKRITKEVAVETMLGLIDQINLAKQYGFVHLRRHLINFALRYPISGYRRKHGGLNEIKFSSDPNQAFSILHDSPRNKHLRYRNWDTAPKGSTSAMYQRAEVRSLSIGTTRKTALSRGFDNYRYYVWWRSKQENVVEEEVCCRSVFNLQTYATELDKMHGTAMRLPKTHRDKEFLPATFNATTHPVDAEGVSVKLRWTEA